ncbi:hypothetical protein Psta_2941 [Pirellula staleyi DSM 6068]|uniref:Uncharacterized protein n=1 Tax=Pirellula staleyi (strain ATCC 27377 / DSM 6068 / ICPB 4128) TaxID=530564 RepID=D2R8R5_PIRSD|nr:hypothetical protein Psta_2941 [Pirellula staleyi DSM 6068]
MIRTTLSFCALFGALLLVFKLMQESMSSPAAAPILSIESGPSTTSPASKKKYLPESTSPASVDPSTTESAASLSNHQLLGMSIPSPTSYRLETVCGNEMAVSRLGEMNTACGVDYALPQSRIISSRMQTVVFSDDITNQTLEQLSGDLKADPTLTLETDIESDVTAAPADATTPAEMTDEPAQGTVTDGPVTEGSEAAATDGEESADKTEEKVEGATELTPELLELRDRLRKCLAIYYYKPENVAIRSPWGAMHAMIAYGVDSELIVGNRRVNAIGWLNYNGVCNNQNLFHLSGGKLQAKIGPGVQGHAGQYLSMLAQSKVKTDFPMLVENQKLTVADLIEHEKLTCRPATELTFKLISLVHYLKSDEKWKSNDGQDWTIERLIQEELKQPIIGAACGGTHRLTGFSYAVRKREIRKEPFDGQWLRAQKFIQDYHKYAFYLQNPDGSFSTSWFVGRADNGPPSRRLETTGHITEWLSFSLSKEELTKPEMIKSVSYLTNLLTEHRDMNWSIGPLGHGLHALAIYDERVFGGKPGNRAEQLAAAMEVKTEATRKE